MEIAVYGGTFNPPTIAHEAIIEACLARPDFDEVWVMPSGERHDKQWQTPDADRLAMLGIMKYWRFQNTQKLRISSFELSREAPTETWYTMDALAEARPQDCFWFVYGADSYQDMPNWQQGERLQTTGNLLVVPRLGYELPKSRDGLKHLTPELPDTHVSSTLARDLAAGMVGTAEISTLEELVHREVAQYIAVRGLYRQAVALQ